MRVVTLVLLAGILCGPVHAQEGFLIENSEPAHGDMGVPLADTVAFSFNKQVAISTDWDREFVFEPNGSVTFDEVSLCLTFLDVCDKGDDIPRHVRYQVDHQPDTDYTWLVYGVESAEGDSMSEPYALRYTTASTIGQGTVSGAVTAPLAAVSPSGAFWKQRPRTSTLRTSLRKLAEGLRRSGLGHPIFDSADGPAPEPPESRSPSGRPKTHFKTIGRKDESEGPYTQVLLVEQFSIDDDAWAVRAGEALIGSSGQYSLDYVRSGTYVPVAVRYTDGASTKIDGLGFHDPDGDGRPNAVEIIGNESIEVDLQLFDFPRTTVRAEGNLPVAIDSAAQYASDQELRWVTAGTGIDRSGTAYEWTYRFYSPSKDLETEVAVNPLAVEVDTSAAPDFLTEMKTIPDGFVDSDVALDTALADGGQQFTDQYPPRNLSTSLSGGNLYWTDTPDASEEFWQVRFVGFTQDSTESFERYVNISNGIILPVELTRFVASAAGPAVQLRWRTASEINNAGFEIQHAVGDATSDAAWEALGFVDGAGTTEEPQTYRFRAGGLSPGTHRFRLRQVDLDGTAHVSDVVRVDLRMEAALRLTPPSPNPVRQTAQFRFGVQEVRPTTVAVYDVLGRKVATLYDGAPPAGQMQTVRLDARTLPSGVYFVRLAAGSRTETRKFTVAK